VAALRTKTKINSRMPGEKELSERTVAVVGLGYVGLPTALSLADRGAFVIGIDISEARLTAIKAGQVEALERDQSRLVRVLSEGRLELTSEPSHMARVDTIIICVPTPVDVHLVPDLGPLRAACDAVAEHAVTGQTIVLTSTSYVGCTSDLLVKPLRGRGFRPGNDIFIAFSPERINPGVEQHAPEETPRVVGGVTEDCGLQAEVVIHHTAGSVHLVSSPEAAELTKLLENTFRAVNIALANEFASAAGKLGLDVMEVISAAATKPYGFMPFYPGAGVGGHCIPCDPHYLLWQLRAHRIASPVMETAMTAISARPRQIVAYARQMLGDIGRPIAGARVLVVGVSYKPGVADLRESPALEILDELAAAGANVAYSDPLVDSLHIPHAGMLTSIAHPVQAGWDLVLTHTLHPHEDYAWINGCPLVLDTTYQLRDVPHRRVP
jgi:UDP-N-acetyl-D-glucosamine dehydrogenase